MKILAVSASIHLPIYSVIPQIDEKMKSEVIFLYFTFLRSVLNSKKIVLASVILKFVRLDKTKIQV